MPEDDRSTLVRIGHVVRHEFYEVVPPTIFFLITFHIVVLDRALMLREYGLRLSSVAAATVMALLVAKVVLIADKLPFINRFPAKPLIYNVVWKTLIYLVVAGFIHYLERLYDFSRQARGIVAGQDKLMAEIIWPHFWAIQMILFILILAYCTTRELVRVIGKDKVLRIFFGPMLLPRFH